MRKKKIEQFIFIVMCSTTAHVAIAGESSHGWPECNEDYQNKLTQFEKQEGAFERKSNTLDWSTRGGNGCVGSLKSDYGTLTCAVNKIPCNYKEYSKKTVTECLKQDANLTDCDKKYSKQFFCQGNTNHCTSDQEKCYITSCTIEQSEKDVVDEKSLNIINWFKRFIGF